MYVLLVMFSILFVLVLLKVVFNIKEAFDNIPQYMKHKSKCYSCEQEILNTLGPDAVFLAQPTKGFDDEIAGIAQAGGDLSGGYLAKTIKYY